MALRDKPYLPLYVKDYLSDEKLRQCSPSSVGVYSFMICVLHKQDEYGTILLKQKDKQVDKQSLNFALKLACQLPYSSEIIEKAILELVDEKVLTIDGDKLFQKRMVKDNDISDKRAEAGSEGGKRTQFALANPEAKEEANPDSDIINDTDNVSIEMEFAFFWDEYDKKVGNKEKLFKKWRKLSNDDRRRVFEYIPRYKKSQPDKQFRKNPDTFLNNHSWNDEIIIKNGKTKLTDEVRADYINK